MTKLLDAPERPLRTGDPNGTAPRAGLARRIRNLLTSPKYGPVTVTAVLFVVIFIAGGLRYRGFFSGQVFLNLLVDNSYLIVLAVGMTFVILTGGIDLSVGAVVALSGMIAASLLQTGWSPAAVIPLILVLTSILGLLVGLMIHVFKVQPFIATLAAMFLARGLCYVISQSSISITDPTFVQLAVARIPLAATSRSPRASSSQWSSWRSPSGSCTRRGSAAPCTRSAAASRAACSWGCPWREPRCSST